MFEANIVRGVIEGCCYITVHALNVFCSYYIVSVKTNTVHADLQNSVDMYKTVEVHVVLDGRNHVFDAFPLLLVSPPLEGRVKVTVFFNVPDVRFTHSVYDQAACMEHEHNITLNPHEMHATIYLLSYQKLMSVGKADGRCQQSRLAATRLSKIITNTYFHSRINS